MFDFDEMEEHYARSADVPAARTLPRLLDSPWLGVSRHRPRAQIRLFCLAGVGVPAASFEAWAGEAMHRRFPAIEVALLELPGHGANDAAEPFVDYRDCAEAIVAELARIHFAGRGEDSVRPFALYGHSLGSRIAAEVAALATGPAGERCRKLYVSGRGAPNVEVLGGALRKRMPDFGRMEPSEVKEAMVRMLEGSISEEQLEKYSRWMEVLERQPGAKSLYRFAKATFADGIMGTGPALPSRSASRGLVDCPIHYYHGSRDLAWPIKVEGQWEHLPRTWAACTTGEFSWSECPGATHGMMGSVESPAFALICEDLTRIAASEPLAAGGPPWLPGRGAAS